MNKSAKLTVRRRTVNRVERTPEELSELRAVRERFQREKPTLEQVLAATGQTETIPLGEYFHAQELLRALRRERERQQVTLAQLAQRTGYDPAVLSRLLSGRQANTTLATVGRIANALGKEVVHTLRDMAASDRETERTKKEKATPENKVGNRGTAQSTRIKGKKAAGRLPAKSMGHKKGNAS
jgi:transcriptional regulator with XRE-family HTH domain